jgi:hypothetical protein
MIGLKDSMSFLELIIPAVTHQKNAILIDKVDIFLGVWIGCPIYCPGERMESVAGRRAWQRFIGGAD